MRAKQYVHLAYKGKVVHAVGRHDAHLSPGFLPCFPHGAFSRRLIVLHKTGRQCPFSFLRLNISAAEKNASLPFRNAAHHQFWVLILNIAATVAYVPQTVIAIWYIMHNFRSAHGAVLNICVHQPSNCKRSSWSTISSAANRSSAFFSENTRGGFSLSTLCSGPSVLIRKP